MALRRGRESKGNQLGDNINSGVVESKTIGRAGAVLPTGVAYAADYISRIKDCQHSSE